MFQTTNQHQSSVYEKMKNAIVVGNIWWILILDTCLNKNNWLTGFLHFTVDSKNEN